MIAINERQFILAGNAHIQVHSVFGLPFIKEILALRTAVQHAGCRQVDRLHRYLALPDRAPGRIAVCGAAGHLHCTAVVHGGLFQYTVVIEHHRVAGLVKVALFPVEGKLRISVVGGIVFAQVFILYILAKKVVRHVDTGGQQRGRCTFGLIPYRGIRDGLRAVIPLICLHVGLYEVGAAGLIDNAERMVLPDVRDRIAFLMLFQLLRG